jgi:hypothetical protein
VISIFRLHGTQPGRVHLPFRVGVLGRARVHRLAVGVDAPGGQARTITMPTRRHPQVEHRGDARTMAFEAVTTRTSCVIPHVFT